MARYLILAVFLALSACTGPSEPHGSPATPHWGYSGHDSPEHWAALCQAFRTCAEGHAQSPIDIETLYAAGVPGHHLDFDYHACTVDIHNNGHTIAVSPEGQNVLSVDGRPYMLRQFHFHEPAEHRVDGVLYPMELHLVHADSAGHLAVVGIFIKEGIANPALSAIWEALPDRPHGHRHPAHLVDLTQVFPEGHRFFHYGGSLTTPPCTEGVDWYVMEQPITLSKGQIGAFRRLYHGNVRPLQDLYGRHAELTE